MRDFLARVLPAGGEYCLLALAPGIKPREINGIGSLDALVDAVSRLSTRPVNLYYATGGFKGHRSKATCIAKRALYLDLDSKDFGSKEAARAELARFVQAVGIPAPAILVDSGRGIHAYWPFNRDLDPEAWTALAGELKGRCQAAGFQADPTVTADAARVLRVPGTLNHKDSTPLPCCVLMDTGEVFDPVALFKQLRTDGPSLPQRAVALAGHVNDALGGGLEYEKPDAATVEGMLSYVGGGGDYERWFEIIRGIHNWSDGSEQGFELVDAWSKSQPKYGGPGPVREKWESCGRYQGRPTTIATIIKYAKEGGWQAPAPATNEPEIDPLVDLSAPGYVGGILQPRALDERKRDAEARGRKRLTEPEAIELLVKEWIFVFDQGKYFSTSKRNVYPHSTINEHYHSRMPQTNGRPTTATSLLANSMYTLQVDSLGFHPGAGPTYTENHRTFANCHTPVSPEIQPTPNELRLVIDFLDYLFPREEDQAFKKYYTQFLGHITQRPGVKIATALLLVGTFGVGKNIAALEIPRRLVGEQNTQMVSNKVLRSSFNDQIGRAHLLYFDEVHCNGHWDASDQANGLKSVVSDTTLEVHPKGLAAYNIPNRLVVTASSNYYDAMFLQRLDRRWGVCEIAPNRGYSRDQARRYYDLIWKFLGSPRASGVLRWIFGRVDLTGFNPQNAPPITTAKLRMTELSDSAEANIIRDAFRNSDKPFDKDLFVLEDIRGMLNAEMGKTYSTHKVANITRDAIGAQELGRINHHNRLVRVWCCRRFEIWKGKTTAEWSREL